MVRLRLTRRLTQACFLLLLFALPVFDILRYDSATKELFLFGDVWTLGLGEGFFADRSLQGAGRVAIQFLLKAILPWIVVLAIFPLLGTLFKLGGSHAQQDVLEQLFLDAAMKANRKDDARALLARVAAAKPVPIAQRAGYAAAARDLLQ